MNQLIAVLQDVDMRLAAARTAASATTITATSCGEGQWQHPSAHQPEDLIESNIYRHGNRKSTAPSFMFFIPTFELLFVVIRRPTAQTG